MSISKSDLQHLSKPGFAALAIGLLGWVAVSSPTHAETFTLQDLNRGASFTIGNVQFFNWSVKDASLDEELITVETIEDPELPGFTIFGNGELRGDRVDLEYEFEVRTINLLPLIFGGVLELTGFSASIDSEIDIETDEGILNLNVFINDFTDEIQLLDAGVLREPTSRTKFEGRVRTDQNTPGAHEVESYTTQILVVSSEACGDGMLSGGEECDPPDGTTCDDNCLDISCGNEIVQPGEECDPPNGVTCDGSCQDIPIACGNDLRQPGEQCDGTDDGACPGACELDCRCPGGPDPICGDDTVDPGEDCDPPNGVTCDGSCMEIPIACGNDLRQPGEQCDGTDDAACPSDCLGDCTCSVPPTPLCGDEVVDAGEQCDPPNGVTCDDSCQDIPIACGNDLRQPGEQCDGTDDAACPGTCQVDCTCSGGPGPYCGDGVMDAPDEECDGADDAACAAGCLLDCTCRRVVLCPFEVDLSCIAADKASLKIDEKKEGTEKLKVSLQKLSEATTPADFGDPVSGTTLYEVCVYGEGGTLVGPLRVDRAGDVCGSKGKPCWAAKKAGPAYNDPDAASGGVKKIQTKSGDAGKGQMKADAANNAKKGQTSLPTGITDRLVGVTQATVQVQTDDAACFGATLDEVKKNDADTFQAKLKN